MLRLIVIIALTGLAGCGADAPPFEPRATGTISVGTNGIRTSTQLEASNGTVTIGVGL